MKAINALLDQIHALHKSGKLDDAVSHKLNVTVARLQHDLHIGDRKNAEKHFGALCELLREVLK